MTDEEKAEEYADKFCKGCNKIHCKIEEECFSHESTRLTFLAGLAEGRKEKQKIVDTQTVAIESRDVYLAEKESIIIRQQTEIQNLEKENEELNRDKTELVNSVTELENKVTELEKQIEKMKACRNCKHYGNYKDDYMCVLVGQKIHCKNKDKWECK